MDHTTSLYGIVHISSCKNLCVLRCFLPSFVKHLAIRKCISMLSDGLCPHEFIKRQYNKKIQFGWSNFLFTNLYHHKAITSIAIKSNILCLMTHYAIKSPSETTSAYSLIFHLCTGYGWMHMVTITVTQNLHYRSQLKSHLHILCQYP